MIIESTRQRNERIAKNDVEYRADMITAGWAFRRGDYLLAEQCYSSAVIHAANNVTRSNPERRRSASRYRAAHALLHRSIDLRQATS